ncbi:MAG: DEAD/DEAH box helicase family protein [Clostridiales bacterium]|jgi:superfamily II DNA or RNA helicase|nr:DEAD/DEAH box helicase family protein [Clostridiales bacterium]
MRLYHWQKECLKVWREAGFHGIVNAATGTGKTMLALAAMDMIERERPNADVRVKIIVPKIFLTVQWIKDIMENLRAHRSSIGVYTGEIKEPRRKYTIYVVNSARYDISSHIIRDIKARRPVLLICDECHHMDSPENIHSFDFYPFADKRLYFSLGLSATPKGENMERTTLALGREIYSYSIKNASRDRIVSDYVVHTVKVPFTEDETFEYKDINGQIHSMVSNLYKGCPELQHAYGGDFYSLLGELASGSGDLSDMASAYRALLFRRKDIVNLAAFRVPCACELVRTMIGRRIIVFAERIQTVNQIFAILNRMYPQRVRRYHSEMEHAAKRSSLEAYKDGDADILLSCKALDEGLNVPDTDVGIIVSATTGIRQRIQRLGRVLRLNPDVGVKNVYYLYVDGSNEDPNLLSGVPTGEELFYEPKLGRVRNPEYEAFADGVMEKFASIYADRQAAGGKSISTAQLDELKRNIHLGALRGDYRLPLAEINEKARTDEIKTKNYWIAMSLVAKRMAGK